MKSAGELMGVLNAYDLTGFYRAAAELCGARSSTSLLHHASARPLRPMFVQLLPSRRNGVHDVQHASRTIFHCAG